MQTINQLNEQIKILQNPDIAHLSMVVVVPISNETDLHRGKVVKTQKILIISIKDETERLLSEEDVSEVTNRRRSKRQNEEEPEFHITKCTNLTSYQITQEVNIYPKCEDGEVFHCQNNTSNESLEENCGQILMFNSETRSCYCEGSNRRKRNSGNILKQGWSKYIR